MYLAMTAHHYSKHEVDADGAVLDVIKLAGYPTGGKVILYDFPTTAMKDVSVTDFGDIEYPEGRVMAKAVLDLADYKGFIATIDKIETRLDDA